MRAILPPTDPTTFITTEKLVKDTYALIPHLPPEIDCVVGVARSGLIPATIIATALHVPLYTVSRQKDVQWVGNGTRLGFGVSPESNLCLVDDTVATGAAMGEALWRTAREFHDAESIHRVAIYVHPKGESQVDLCASVLDGPHYLEWNWQNAGHGRSCAYDFDGILCRDFTHAECIDEETYTRTMETIEPLYLPRRKPVPLIVTARHETYRRITEAWLAKWGVECEKLVMRDFGHPVFSCHSSDVAAWKAKHYNDSKCVLFAESDPYPARLIAAASHKPVLGPTMGRVIQGEQVEPVAPYNPIPAETLQKIRDCPYRLNMPGGYCCSRGLNDRGSTVTLGKCVQCVSGGA